MKHIPTLTALLVLPALFTFANTINPQIDSLISHALTEFRLERQQIQLLEASLLLKGKEIDKEIRTTKKTNRIVALILLRDSVRMKLEILKVRRSAEIRKIRYLKGVQIINLLYQKTLSLDHHFSSVATLGEIHRISNPNNYPEFVRIRDRIKPDKRVKTGFDPEPILQSNVYTSVIYSVIEAFIKPQKEKKLSSQNSKDLSCIIDFTSRMHQDLKTIYYETFYLQRSNEIIHQDMEQLFEDFTKPIGFSTSLTQCYKGDLWEEIQSKLNAYVDKMLLIGEEQPSSSKLDRMQIELDFPIDRLSQFIYSYNSFIEQGTRFYEKFGAMLGDYQSDANCEEQLPVSYTKLKDQIGIAIHKFRTAYRPVEINGSKYKELLYGLSEYD